jgi:hypothetical protein
MHHAVSVHVWQMCVRTLAAVRTLAQYIHICIAAAERADAASAQALTAQRYKQAATLEQ